MRVKNVILANSGYIC